MKQTKHLAGAHEDVFSMERSGVSLLEGFSFSVRQSPLECERFACSLSKGFVLSQLHTMILMGRTCVGRESDSEQSFSGEGSFVRRLVLTGYCLDLFRM